MQPKKKDADPKAPKELGKPLTPAVQIARVRFSPDGNALAAACFDGTVRRWDVSAAEPAELPPITGHNGWVSSIAFDGTTLVSVDSWGRLTASDVSGKEPKRLWTVEAAHDGWARAAVVSPDGARLATVGRDGFVRLWNPADGKKVAEFGAKADLLSVCFAPDGKAVLAGDLFGVVREFEVPGGKVVRTFEAKELHKVDRIQDVGGVRCLVFAGDGKTLLVAGAEPQSGGFTVCTPVLIGFDRETGKRAWEWKGGGEKEGYVTDLGWHPGGFAVGTTSGQPGQGKCYFWRVGEAAPFATAAKFPNCHSVAVHPDGTRLAVSATNANSSGNGRPKGKDGEYPENTSPVQLWTVPKA